MRTSNASSLHCLVRDAYLLPPLCTVNQKPKRLSCTNSLFLYDEHINLNKFSFKINCWSTFKIKVTQPPISAVDSVHPLVAVCGNYMTKMSGTDWQLVSLHPLHHLLSGWHPWSEQWLSETSSSFLEHHYSPSAERWGRNAGYLETHMCSCCKMFGDKSLYSLIRDKEKKNREQTQTILQTLSKVLHRFV